MSKNQQRKCWVCGDNAIGRNFCAISCESCRSFFRRNALKIESLKCKTNGKCVINVGNRKNCQKCRLNKCLAVGMKKEFILLNDRKIDSERVRANSISTTIDSNSSSSNDLTHFDPEFDALFENCSLSEQQINEQIIQIQESLNNSTESIDWEMINEIPEHYVVPVVRPIVTYNKKLNDIEVNHIQELSTAKSCIQYLYNSFAQNIIEFKSLRDYFSSTQIIEKSDQVCRQYIKSCKRLTSFKEICEQDKLSLIKYGLYEAISWLTITTFNFEKECYTLYYDNENTLRIPLVLFRREDTTFYEMVRTFYRKIRPEWISDPTIINLLSALVIFNPNRPNLVHKELIKLKQQMYLYLLQRYLIQKYSSESESAENCSKLLSSVHEFESVTKSQIEFQKGFVHNTTPLLKALLDT